MATTKTETIAEKKNRTKPARKYTTQDVDFVYKNYTQMTATQIAEERDLARFQVQQIVTNLRKAGADVPKKTSINIIQDYVNSVTLGKGKKKK